MDGAVLTVEKGINLTIYSQTNSNDAMLTIYAQSQGKNMGCIISTGEENRAGILVHSPATLTINGGFIYAIGGVGAAGIGGNCSIAKNALKDAGKIVINGGVVIAEGRDGGAGIGGGADKNPGLTGDYIFGGYGANLYIYGGLVTAIGGENGKAIGCGAGKMPEDDDQAVPHNHRGVLTLSSRIAVYDGVNDTQLTGTTFDIFNQIIDVNDDNTVGTNPITTVVFETHTPRYKVTDYDEYALLNGELNMVVDGKFSDFQYLRLDNKKLASDAYIAVESSTGDTCVTFVESQPHSQYKAHA